MESLLDKPYFNYNSTQHNSSILLNVWKLYLMHNDFKQMPQENYGPSSKCHLDISHISVRNGAFQVLYL